MFGRPCDEAVERTSGAAVGVGDEHLAPGLAGERIFEGRHDPLGSVVEVGRQVADLDRVGETAGDEHGAQLGRERAAADDEWCGDEWDRGERAVAALRQIRGHDHATDGPAGSARILRRAFTSALAVSAATAASRQ